MMDAQISSEDILYDWEEIQEASYIVGGEAH